MIEPAMVGDSFVAWCLVYGVYGVVALAVIGVAAELAYRVREGMKKRKPGYGSLGEPME